MALVPHAQQISAVYTLTNVAGIAAVFNDSTSPNYVGDLTGENGITGLDSPEIREVAANLVESDGGIHGRFYKGRRPVTMSGDIAATSVTDRNSKIDRLNRVIASMLRSDATLKWTVSGGVETFVDLRWQQPFRTPGGFRKNFFLAMVAAQPCIFSTQLHSQAALAHSTNHSIENRGSAYSAPALLRVTGPGTNPVVRRTYNGATYNLQFNGLSLAAGEYIDIDVLDRTILKSDGSNQYNKLLFPVSTWWALGPQTYAGALNTLRLDWASGATAASVLRVDWRDAWL